MTRICKGVGSTPCPTNSSVEHKNRKRCPVCSPLHTKLLVRERVKAEYTSRKRLGKLEEQHAPPARVSYATMSAQVDAVLKYTL